MKKITLMLMILSMLTKMVGFLREIILAYFYGASNISDVYLISLTIPSTIFAFIGVGIATSFIPVFSNVEKEGDLSKENKYINNVLNLMMLLCTLIIIIVIISAPLLVKVFASGFDKNTLKLAVLFTRIAVISIYFKGILHILKSYLNVKGNFIMPGLVGIPFSLVIIISIILSYKINLIILCVGYVLARICEVIILIPSCYKKKLRYKLFINFEDKDLNKMIFLALPVVLGISVNQINILVDRTLASRIAIGGISALNYANKLNFFIQGIFVLSLVTVMYPMISKMVASNNMIGLKKTLSRAISGVNLLVIPATIGSMIFAKPIVCLLFGRGAFDSAGIRMTYHALFFYSIGMIGFGLREVLSRVFYSMQDTKTPTFNAAIGMLLNILLNIILSRFLGIAGLAFATSISAIFTTGILFISLRKKIGSFDIKGISISFLKILSASLVMGLIAKLSYKIMKTSISQNISLLISIIIGAITYFTIIYFLKIKDVDVTANIIKKMLKKNAITIKDYLCKSRMKWEFRKWGRMNLEKKTNYTLEFYELIGMPASGKTTLKDMIIKNNPDFKFVMEEVPTSYFSKQCFKLKAIIMFIISNPKDFFKDFYLIVKTKQSVHDLISVSSNWFMINYLYFKNRNNIGRMIYSQGIYQALWSIAFSAQRKVDMNKLLKGKILPKYVYLCDADNKTLTKRAIKRRKNSRLDYYNESHIKKGRYALNEVISVINSNSNVKLISADKLLD